ncbi:SRPBCC family protein [Rhodococcus spongiicola]|uniref:SRPBCC family protein n=1 Tax=Rhodococcus spongiicola TaxID=2487352 RepID=A0A3S3A5H9_9NOCA|nr:SRPBCC family protein [Rhodococcus spongiicola]RVW02513.1 SRPBCC family protein [Rhodococcus spongiicola]
MPDFTINRQIQAPVEKVWSVLNDFGNIARWNPGVKRSALTSDGPVSEGTTRHCDLAPLGGVEERIDTYIPNERMTVNLYETYKLPISGGVADFNIAPHDSGTELTLHYSYTPNLLGRVAKGSTDKQLRKGIGGLADALKEESEKESERDNAG